MNLPNDTESEEEMRKSLGYMMSNKKNKASVPMEINRLLKSKLRKINKRGAGDLLLSQSVDNSPSPR